MNDELKECPSCQCPYGYANGEDQYACPQSSFEWKPSEEEISDAINVVDSNGTPLQNGDTVVVIKDLPVKGAPKAIKAGTKVKNIRLVQGDHNIDCKVDGFGAMALKSIFVRKA
jgi:protein PhnA